jgi:membrane-associated protein
MTVMEFLAYFIDIFIHLDVHLSELIAQFGPYIYLILFLIIFCETGLVVTPFLPGDSLLFVIGAFAAKGDFELGLIFAVLAAAAISGNIVNYHIGRYVGPRVFQRETRFLKKEYLESTRAFYEKHGAKTIVIARFLPIIRTFAPFVAGIGRMEYKRFTIYNIIGCMAWLGAFILGGYFFGNVPMVKQNLTIVILAIVVLSFVPSVIEFMRHRRRINKQQ